MGIYSTKQGFPKMVTEFKFLNSNREKGRIPLARGSLCFDLGRIAMEARQMHKGGKQCRSVQPKRSM